MRPLDKNTWFSSIRYNHNPLIIDLTDKDFNPLMFYPVIFLLTNSYDNREENDWSTQDYFNIQVQKSLKTPVSKEIEKCLSDGSWSHAGAGVINIQAYNALGSWGGNWYGQRDYDVTCLGNEYMRVIGPPIKVDPYNLAIYLRGGFTYTMWSSKGNLSEILYRPYPIKIASQEFVTFGHVNDYSEEDVNRWINHYIENGYGDTAYTPISQEEIINKLNELKNNFKDTIFYNRINTIANQSNVEEKLTKWFRNGGG